MEFIGEDGVWQIEKANKEKQSKSGKDEEKNGYSSGETK